MRPISIEEYKLRLSTGNYEALVVWSITKEHYFLAMRKKGEVMPEFSLSQVTSLKKSGTFKVQTYPLFPRDAVKAVGLNEIIYLCAEIEEEAAEVETQ